MSELTHQTDPYLSVWNPQEYLRQYFLTPYIPDDSQAVLQFLIEQLSYKAEKYNRAIDFGCGPTLYTAIAIVPYVRELHLVDYLSENLHAVCQWLDDKSDAHDWDVYFRGILELENGKPGTAGQVNARKAELRQKITVLKTGDIRSVHPLGQPESYDLVASFFCIEAVTKELSEWEKFLGRLSNLVAPGGTMVLAAVRHCNGYELSGRQFPATFVGEDDFARVLPRFGFPRESLVIRAVPTAEWAEEGFDSICLVAAMKNEKSMSALP